MSSAAAPPPPDRARAFAAAGALGGVLVLAGFLSQPSGLDLSSPAGGWLLVGRVAALAGTYLALLGLLLSARVPWLERAAGHDQLLGWHAKLGRYAVALIIAHVVAITLGYAGSETFVVELWVLITQYPWMLSAGVGFVFLLAASVASLARMRRRIRYESWWQLHLYFYLAIALAFAHQVVDGVMFADAPVYRMAWIALYAGVFCLLLVFRVGRPLVRSWRASVKVAAVQRHQDGTVSVSMTGRNVHRLGARPGQFFNWRFAPAWWQAHPYSLSKSAADGVLRITVKPLGDHSRSLAALPVGSSVTLEGPYGAFTWDRVTSDRIVMLAGGIGITPIRALLDEVPPGLDVHLIYRCDRETQFIFADELLELGVRTTYVAGPPAMHPLDGQQLLALDPQIHHGDVFLCGPPAMKVAVIDALHRLGTPDRRIHVEDFSWAVGS